MAIIFSEPLGTKHLNSPIIIIFKVLKILLKMIHAALRKIVWKFLPNLLVLTLTLTLTLTLIQY